MRLPISILLLLCLCLSGHSQSLFSRALEATGVQQGAANEVKRVSEKSLHFIQSKYRKLTTSLDKQSQKMLSRMERKERKLRDKLYRQDSAAAAKLFGEGRDKYAALKGKLHSPFDSSKAFPLTEYLPGVDSLQTTLRFLKEKGLDLSPDKLKDINKAAGDVQALENKLQKANEIEAFVRERERQLKEQLQNSPFTKSLKSINKEAFYYGQRLREYKEALNSPEKAEEKLVSAVRESHLFQSFMQKHSYLAKLFPQPDNYGTPAALAGLQTRAGVQGQLQQRFGVPSFASSASSGTGSSGTNYLQGQVQSAQAQLSTLKDKMNKLGINSGSSDMTMPDFKPNSQHTKSFLQRIEYGANIQSEKSHSIVPTTSDIAFTAGYKMNDKSTVGIGGSYKMGWGSEGIRHIKLSGEGVGLRSYVDIRAKGSIWVSGGYEMNYMQSFQKYEQLKNISAWQRSGLIGLTKKYKVGKKENNLQLLWDFLSYQQLSRSPAIKFRVGFKL